MFKRILVPLDGSERAERAIPVAASIARQTQGSIVFIRVVPQTKVVEAFGIEASVEVEPGLLGKKLGQAALSIAKSATTYADMLKDIPIETDVATGDPSGIIFSAAALEHADLIILCSHGATGFKRLVFKSVARQAVRRSPVPILVLNEHGEIPVLPEASNALRILVPLDGSPLAESALEPAVALASALSTAETKEIHLLQIISPPEVYADMAGGPPPTVPREIEEQKVKKAEKYLSDVVEHFKETSPFASSVTLTTSSQMSADVTGTILKEAEQVGKFDLIAMATHGRSGLKRLVMGSVTETVLGNTLLPMLIIRPHQMEAVPEADYKITIIEKDEIMFGSALL